MTLVTGANGRSVVSIGSVLMPQSGAATDMLASAVDACPKELRDDPTNPPEFWYLACHTLSITERSVGRH